MRLFSVNLAFVFVMETIAVWMANNGKYNVQLYNILSSIEIMFFLWFFMQIIDNTAVKRIIKITIIIYPLIVLANKFLVQKGLQYHSLTAGLGGLLVVVAAVYYFFELFDSDKIINLVREPAFWISSGLLFFYSCSFPLFTLITFFYSPSDSIIFYLADISSVLNILLYSSFIVAFLCRIKIRKFSL